MEPRLRPEELASSLGSPLRLFIIDALREAGAAGIPLDRLVVIAGRPAADVRGVLVPTQRAGVITMDADGQVRLAPDLPAELHAVIDAVLIERRAWLDQAAHVRRSTLCGMIGADPKMQVLFDQIHVVARLDLPVLITGETGTGKELVARAIHELSPRREREFGTVNCGAVSDELFASEMFGHVKGAFTGAVRAHRGLVEIADRGTLFLDEVGELSLANQVKLLRTLQEGVYRRLGDDRARQSDFRVVAATNRELGDHIAEGLFREDLYYRLNVFPMRLPSLRERLGDIPWLAEELLGVKLRGRVGGCEVRLAGEATARLQRHTWPGNVRELENVLLRAAVLADDGVITADLVDDIVGESPEVAPPATTGRRPLADVERDHIVRILALENGNMSAAARVLEIARSTLYRKAEQYGILPE